MDQETEKELARIHQEWARLEEERVVLEAEHAEWRVDLLKAADELGMGERFRETLRQTGG